MCQAAAELFPRSPPPQPTVPEGVARMWELRKAARNCTLGPWTSSKTVVRAEILSAWRKAARFLAGAKQERDRSARAKADRMEGLLREAKVAADRHDSNALFTIVRQLRPWEPRPHINFLDSHGSPLTVSEQHGPLLSIANSFCPDPLHASPRRHAGLPVGETLRGGWVSTR